MKANRWRELHGRSIREERLDRFQGRTDPLRFVVGRHNDRQIDHEPTPLRESRVSDAFHACEYLRRFVAVRPEGLPGTSLYLATNLT